MMYEVISRLWSMSLQAGILILVVLAVRFFLKKYPKVYMYFLWTLVGIRLLCPVFVEAPFSLQPETIRPDGIVWNGGVLTDRESDSRGLLPDGQGLQPDISGKEDMPSGELTGYTNAGTGMISLSSGKDANGNDSDNFNLSNSNNDSDHENMITKFIQKMSDVLAFDSTASDLTGIFGLLAIIYLAGAGVFFIFYVTQYLIIKHRVSTAVREKKTYGSVKRLTRPLCWESSNPGSSCLMV